MAEDLREGGPYFDDLAIGDVFDWAPSVTLTEGFAATHHAIVGGRLRLALDRGLAMAVAGRAVVSPALAWDVSIGQSTLVTQRAVANLFYRNLHFLRLPAIGDTLTTRTGIVGLRSTERKLGRLARGLVVMRIETRDQERRPILDYFRCAMLPDRGAEPLGASGILDPVRYDDFPAAAVDGWDLEAFRASVPGPHFSGLREGESRTMPADLVSSAPELARLTLNLAAVHHDASAADGERLVYGGHTIGIAAAQCSRALPNLVTILGWRSCDHLGPVREGDTLVTTFKVERTKPLSRGGGVAEIHAWVERKTDAKAVLDWRFFALFA